MITFIEQKRPSFLFRIVSCFIVLSFVFTSVVPPQMASAQVGVQSILNLPVPGEMITVSDGYQPALIKGIITHPDNPLEFDFIVAQGDNRLNGEAFNDESRKMIKYFLAALTTPEEEMWVNLSPYEGNRIIPTGLGVTEMGRDLLAQDYILKQLTASLMYPEDNLGTEFWTRVHKKAQALYNTTEIPTNTFSKIWIVPESAVVYQKGSSAFVLENKLKVMLEEDYVALEANQGNKQIGADQINAEDAKIISGVTSEIIKEVLIPEIEFEVNHGKHFAKLRQIANAMVLATWYKKNLKESLLGYVYLDQNKTSGIDVEDKDIKQKIYNQYLKAFEKGVYNYIKEDYDPRTNQVIPRKYFSGGVVYTSENVRFFDADRSAVPVRIQTMAANQFTNVEEDNSIMSVNVDLIGTGANAAPNAIRDLQKVADSGSFNVTFGNQLSLRGKPNADFAILSKEDLDKLAVGMANFDKSYMAGLYDKYVALMTGKAADSTLTIGDNFKPSALLRADELASLLGARIYSTDIAGDETYIKAAKDVVLISNPMNGGLGSSVSRTSYLQEVAGRSELGAKGTDLFFSVPVQGVNEDGSPSEVTVQVSVTELKYIQALRSAGKYSNVVMQELVNEDSVGPMTKFLDETVYLFDRIDQRPNSKNRTYRQIIEETEGIEVAEEMILQGALPVIDVADNNLTFDYSAPGGHGQLGSMVLQEALTAELPEGKVVIRAVFNGDGPNNSISEDIAGFMASENIPIVMISTTKTSLDKKGGLIGVETTVDGKTRAQMLELAQAKSNNQEALFTAMGLTEGQRGGQFFNTNVAAVNYTALQPFLRELKDIIGETEFNQIVTPDLIPNAKEKDGGRKVVQLEGAMGSALLNLNGYVTTTDNVQVQSLMQKYGFERLLSVVNTDRTSRSKFFTPIKFAYDFVLYSKTDHFGIDIERGTLVNKKPGHLPGFATMDDHYKDVKNSLDAFTGTGMTRLTEISVLGKVNMPRTDLIGEVAVNSFSSDVIDLNNFADQIGVNTQGRLQLENVYIEINEAGQLAQIRPIDQVDLAQVMLPKPTVTRNVPRVQREKSIDIGTSGVREVGFNKDRVGVFAKAVGEVLSEAVRNGSRKPLNGEKLKVGLTFGGRRNARELAQRAAEVLYLFEGIEVFVADTISTTPGAIGLTRQELGEDALDVVLHVDASHNDASYNGMKIFENGVVAAEALTNEFKKVVNQDGFKDSYLRLDSNSARAKGIKKVNPVANAYSRYDRTFPTLVTDVSEYLSQNTDVDLIVDGMHGASPQFLDRLREIGATVLRTNPMRSRTSPRTYDVLDENGQTINVLYKPEPVKKFLDKDAFSRFENEAREGSIYMAIDGDADRLAVWIKQDGQVVEMLPNDLGILFGAYLLESGRTTGATKIIKTLPTTSGLMALAKANGLEPVETPVGSKWFAPYMNDLLIATEESGHQVIRIGDDVYFDDAVVQAMLFLEILANRKQSPVQILSSMKSNIAGYDPNWVYDRNDIDLTEEIAANIKEPLTQTADTAEEAQRIRDNIRGIVSTMNDNVGQEALNVEITKSDGVVINLDEFLADTSLRMKVGDGLKFNYANSEDTNGENAWVQFRLSGTEPITRIYAEGPTAQVQARLNNAMGSTLKIPENLYKKDADFAMLSINVAKTFPNLNPALATVIQERILLGTKENPGIASVASRNLYEFTDKSQVQATIQDRLTSLFTAIPGVDALYIDGELIESGRGGNLVVRATSLDSTFNLSTGTANGTSFEIYSRAGNRLQIQSNGRVLWGTRQRVSLSDGTKTQDYVLTESNDLVEVEKYNDTDDNSLTIESDGKTFAFGGFSKDRPVGVQSFMREVMPTISGAKNRNAEALTPDSYLIANKNGMMANWLTWGEAFGLAQFYEASNASVMVMTNQGMRNVSDIPITERLLSSQEQVYVYAGSRNLVARVANFLDARTNEYSQNARTKLRAPRTELSDSQFKETFSEYLAQSVNVPATAGVSPATATFLKKQALQVANALISSYLNPTTIAPEGLDNIQQDIIQELAEKLPGAVIDDGRKLNSMRGILRGYEKDPTQEKIENNSGDLQHPLDFSFDRVINYTLRENGVSAIISEEVAEILQGIGTQDINTYRLVAFTDPIDGSSQIEDAGAFGSIIFLGFLKPGETLEDGDFDPRSRTLFGFDLGYATGTSIGLFNLANNQGQSEVVQFGLTKTDQGELEFRKELTFDNLIDVELQQDFERGSLLPAVDTQNPENSALHLALGGALADSSPQYRVFMEGLIGRFGMVPQYSGALQIDEKRLSTVSKFTKASGVGYFYPTQFKDGKGSQKLRLFFEGYYYAVKRRAMGAEVLNGDTVAPLLNDRARGNTPSGQKASIMSGSSWIMKMYMRWVDHLERNEYRLGQLGTTNETELKREYNRFVTNYISTSSDLILALKAESQKENRQPKSETEIRRALLTFDSTGKESNYFPRLFDLSASNVYSKLFGADKAMLANVDMQKTVDSLVDTFGNDIVNQMDAIYGLTAEEASAIRATNKYARIGFEDNNNRMGWGLPHVKELVANPSMLEQTLQDAADIRENYDDVIFVGMGGSGLTVATTTTTFGQPEQVKVHSLRTTDRDAIYTLLDTISKDRGIPVNQALSRTKIIVVTKSRTTRETLDNKDYFEGLFDQYGVDTTGHFMFVSDPKTPELDQPYLDAGYELRNIQLNGKTDIGGRYTAPTTNIALMPLALINPDLVQPYLEQAQRMNDVADKKSDTFLSLGIYLHHMATQRGKDKVTFLVPNELRDLPIWSEQLFEESLGKRGKGITVVFGEELTPELLSSELRRDRVFVRFNLDGQKAREDLAEVLDGREDVFDVDLENTTQLGGVFLGLQRAVQTVAFRWSDKLGDLNGVRQDAVEGYKKATNAEMDALNLENAKRLIADASLDEIEAVYVTLGLTEPTSVSAVNEDITTNKQLAEALSRMAIDRGIGTDIDMPAQWEYGTFDSLRVYYTPFIEAGITTREALEAEVQRLGSTLNDGAAVYAALLNLAQSNGLRNPDGGLFELSEMASFGQMTPEFKTMMQEARTSLFTNKLKVASKLNERPDGNHSFHQSVEDGPNYHLSTFFIPFGVNETTYPEYGFNLIRAQGIGTSNALISAKRKVIPIQMRGTTSDSVEAVERFFDSVESKVTALADAAVLSVVNEDELQSIAASIDDIVAELTESDDTRVEEILAALKGADQNELARRIGALGITGYEINAREFVVSLASELNVDPLSLAQALGRSDVKSVSQLGQDALNVQLEGAEAPSFVAFSVNDEADATVTIAPSVEGEALVGTPIETPLGGIDLNPQLLDLQIIRDDAGIPLPVNQQPIENMNINGFIPVIINVTPISNLPLLLGLAETNENIPEEISYNPSWVDRVARFEMDEIEQVRL